MASKTEIANLAISHLGIGKEIQDFDTDKSEEAQAARRFYENARRSTLRDHQWPFASRFVTLNLIAEKPNDDWNYSYRYPSDAVNLTKILSGLRNDNRQSQISYEVSSDDTARLIYTDRENACLKYTKDITNVDLFADDFIIGLSYRLAAFMAPRLTKGDPFGLRTTMMQMYVQELSLAKASSNNETQPDEQPLSEFERAHGTIDIKTLTREY